MTDDTPCAIPGYSRYTATPDGRILSQYARRPLVPLCDKDGYLVVSVFSDSGKRQPIGIHRLVLMAYSGTPLPGQVGRHLNGNQLDNRAANLAWGTTAENAADMERHGTAAWLWQRGETSPGVKLTEEKVRDIEERVNLGESLSSLAREYDITVHHVGNIRDHTTWRHLWVTPA